jgi:hypothetical protein
MNTHTPKWTPILRVAVLVDFWIFRERLQGSNPIALRSSLYHWKSIETYMAKIGSHDPFRHLKHKLGPKERPGVKLAVWLTTIKSQELTRFPCMQVACNIPLKNSQRGLQLCFRLHPDQRSAHKVMGPQSRRSPNFGNFRTPIWESRDKKSFGCGPCGEA